MKTHLASTLPAVVSASLLRFGLLTVLLAACAPAAAAETSSAQTTAPAVVIQPSATLQVDISSPTPKAVANEAAPTALPVATSRGPDLEATDPLTVSLASGQIQFVEFFRFT